jgi:methylenetetrahydrofolate reductase (NADPH)
MDALRWKQEFSERTDAEMAIATQFAFEAAPIIAWADRLREAGITLPVHIGIAGPAKLQTLIKFAIACGVGPSLKVLQKRAMDVTKLLLPFEPTEVLSRSGRAQGRAPGLQHRPGAFLPARRHQDQRHLGDRRHGGRPRPARPVPANH